MVRSTPSIRRTMRTRGPRTGVSILSTSRRACSRRRHRSRRSKLIQDIQLSRSSVMRPIVPLVLVTVLAAGCASVPPDQDPVQIRLNDLDARVSKVERVVSNQSLVQMDQQVNTLQAEVRDL